MFSRLLARKDRPGLPRAASAQASRAGYSARAATSGRSTQTFTPSWPRYECRAVERCRRLRALVGAISARPVKRVQHVVAVIGCALSAETMRLLHAILCRSNTAAMLHEQIEAAEFRSHEAEPVRAVAGFIQHAPAFIGQATHRLVAARARAPARRPNSFLSS